jgi:hypothetical protein
MKTAAPAFPATFFPVGKESDSWSLPAWVLALAILALFTVVHFAADMLPNLAQTFRLGANAPAWMEQERLLAQVWIPLKGIAFRLSVLLLALPFAQAVYRFFRTLEAEQIRQALRLSIPVFLMVGLLSFPYQDGSGLSSMGYDYGVISAAPFAVKSGFFYRRLLVPGLAYVLGFSGVYGYYLFALGMTWSLIFLTALALQRWLATDAEGTFTPTENSDNQWVALAVLSAATLSYIAFHYQFPGYTEQFGHAIILLLALVPMRSQARWAGIALGLATHDLMLFVLFPIIVFFFRPVKERVVALAIMGLYVFLWLAAYGFRPLAVVKVHTDLAPAVNPIEIFLHEGRWVTIGTLAAQKVFWVLFVWAVIHLLRRRQLYAALALASVTLTPLVTLVVATDTSRLAGLGFLGVLLALTILWRSLASGWQRSLLRALLVLNLLLPSIYVAANYHRIPRAGLLRH